MFYECQHIRHIVEFTKIDARTLLFTRATRNEDDLRADLPKGRTDQFTNARLSDRWRLITLKKTNLRGQKWYPTTPSLFVESEHFPYGVEKTLNILPIPSVLSNIRLYRGMHAFPIFPQLRSKFSYQLSLLEK